MVRVESLCARTNNATLIPARIGRQLRDVTGDSDLPGPWFFFWFLYRCVFFLRSTFGVRAMPPDAGPSAGECASRFDLLVGAAGGVYAVGWFAREVGIPDVARGGWEELRGRQKAAVVGKRRQWRWMRRRED